MCWDESELKLKTKVSGCAGVCSDVCVQLSMTLRADDTIIWFGWGSEGSTTTHTHTHRVSWQAEPPCDNKPDGQRTRRAWLGKHHMTPAAISVFLSLFNHVIFVSVSFEDGDACLFSGFPLWKPRVSADLIVQTAHFHEWSRSCMGIF